MRKFEFHYFTKIDKLEGLEKAKKATRPRKVDLYDIFRAVLYILKTGSQWRNLPKDFPNWELVYYYFTVWKKPKENGESLLEEILKRISTKNLNCRREEGKNKFCNHSQSVKKLILPKKKAMMLVKKFCESSVTFPLIHKVCRMR